MDVLSSGVDSFSQWRGRDQVHQLRSQNSCQGAHGFTLLAAMPQLEREYTHTACRRHQRNDHGTSCPTVAIDDARFS